MVNKKSLIFVLAVAAMGLASCGGSGSGDKKSSSSEAPVVTSEPAPVVTSEEAPVVTSEPAPAETSEPAPVVTSEEAPVVTSEEAPVVTSEPAPVVKSEETPVVTSEEAPVVQSEVLPVVTSEEAPVVTSEEAPVVTSEEGPSGEGTISLWCPTDDTELFNERIAEFKAANPDNKYEYKVVANYGEGDVAAALAKDASAAADMFAIADDNIPTPAKNGFLAALTEDEEAAVLVSDGAAGVQAGSYKDTLYGYPYRADNGYILFYNPTIFDEETVESMDALMAAAADEGVKVYWDLKNGWYGPSPFWANGVEFTVDADTGKMVTGFGTEEAAEVADTLMDMYTTYGGTTWVLSSDTGVIDAGFEDGTVGAFVLWNHYSDLVAKVGEDNVACAKLPELRIGEENKQLGSFNGYKYMSINAKVTGDKLAAAKAFAAFFTNEENQLKNLAAKNYGPSNLEAAASPEVQAKPFLGQIAEMVSLGATVAQGPNVNDNFWTPMGSVGAALEAGTWGEGYETSLDFMLAVADAMEK